MMKSYLDTTLLQNGFGTMNKRQLREKSGRSLRDSRN